VRGNNLEASAGIQHELMPRLSLDFTYYWRWFRQFYVTDNLAAGRPTTAPIASPAH
jgi:hypothetical protein